MPKRSNHKLMNNTSLYLKSDIEAKRNNLLTQNLSSQQLQLKLNKSSERQKVADKGVSLD